MSSCKSTSPVPLAICITHHWPSDFFFFFNLLQVPRLQSSSRIWLLQTNKNLSWNNLLAFISHITKLSSSLYLGYNLWDSYVSVIDRSYRIPETISSHFDYNSMSSNMHLKPITQAKIIETVFELYMEKNDDNL
jgi:hypothetical protein